VIKYRKERVIRRVEIEVKIRGVIKNEAGSNRYKKRVRLVGEDE
jgi:hypothetical protein